MARVSCRPFFALAKPTLRTDSATYTTRFGSAMQTAEAASSSIRAPTPLERPRRVPIPLERPRRVPTPLERPRRVPTPLERPRRVPTPLERPRRVPTPLERPRRAPTPLGLLQQGTAHLHTEPHRRQGMVHRQHRTHHGGMGTGAAIAVGAVAGAAALGGGLLLADAMDGDIFDAGF
ncbi:hypothetical protein VOLCADRAFT_94826 [Volvox carteri f. nagariensis]|uniref:Uncharacterized protein n=1 Tax=Volvox carteri f. nagariensis TaxID=3068 RepID=D8U5V5_VOLCA|nr:uncharacterized protein VOLCADRAFT_94826 [Volvox carteri f. nagariensis]EFJ44822.1 hypothetical protein VOLCADRAFT_94826 [Volvox carteri f. nagariensis]|eukprot:XP_002954105.1 hypothetical protein VOLCADRAFT_94826 [Volvox carteri f. nagariensis]